CSYPAGENAADRRWGRVDRQSEPASSARRWRYGTRASHLRQTKRVLWRASQRLGVADDFRGLRLAWLPPDEIFLLVVVRVYTDCFRDSIGLCPASGFF